MSQDLNSLLKGWDFEPGEIKVRKVPGNDGKEKLQLRLDLGALQMELDGRPDGKRPFGKESLLEHFRDMAARWQAEHGNDTGFRLNNEDCASLQQEAIQYYHRYLSLFQLEEWDRVIRDTARNLKVVDLVSRYGETEEMKWSFLQFRPYLIMMHTRSIGEKHLASGEFDLCIKNIEWGLERIREFHRSQNNSEAEQNSSELKMLTQWLGQVRGQRPLSKREKLQKELADAIAREQYERAAQLRDTLRELEATEIK